MGTMTDGPPGPDGSGEGSEVYEEVAASATKPARRAHDALHHHAALAFEFARYGNPVFLGPKGLVGVPKPGHVHVSVEVGDQPVFERRVARGSFVARFGSDPEAWMRSPIERPFSWGLRMIRKCQCNADVGRRGFWSAHHGANPMAYAATLRDVVDVRSFVEPALYGEKGEVPRGAVWNRYTVVFSGGCTDPYPRAFVCRGERRNRARGVDEPVNLLLVQWIGCERCEACRRRRAAELVERVRAEVDLAAARGFRTWWCTWTFRPEVYDGLVPEAKALCERRLREAEQRRAAKLAAKRPAPDDKEVWAAERNALRHELYGEALDEPASGDWYFPPGEEPEAKPSVSGTWDESFWVRLRFLEICAFSRLQSAFKRMRQGEIDLQRRLAKRGKSYVPAKFRYVVVAERVEGPEEGPGRKMIHFHGFIHETEGRLRKSVLERHWQGECGHGWFRCPKPKDMETRIKYLAKYMCKGFKFRARPSKLYGTGGRKWTAEKAAALRESFAAANEALAPSADYLRAIVGDADKEQALAAERDAFMAALERPAEELRGSSAKDHPVFGAPFGPADVAAAHFVGAVHRAFPEGYDRTEARGLLEPGDPDDHGVAAFAEEARAAAADRRKRRRKERWKPPFVGDSLAGWEPRHWSERFDDFGEGRDPSAEEEP